MQDLRSSSAGSQITGPCDTYSFDGVEVLLVLGIGRYKIRCASSKRVKIEPCRFRTYRMSA